MGDLLIQEGMSTECADGAIRIIKQDLSTRNTVGVSLHSQRDVHCRSPKVYCNRRVDRQKFPGGRHRQQAIRGRGPERGRNSNYPLGKIISAGENLPGGDVDTREVFFDPSTRQNASADIDFTIVARMWAPIVLVGH